MKRAALLALFILLAQPASADFYSFAEWEALPPNFRAVYLAGIADAAGTGSLDTFDQELTRRTRECLSRARINTGQLANAVIAQVMTNPSLRSGTVQAAYRRYMSELCPDLLSNQALAPAFDAWIKEQVNK